MSDEEIGATLPSLARKRAQDMTELPAVLEATEAVRKLTCLVSQPAQRVSGTRRERRSGQVDHRCKPECGCLQQVLIAIFETAIQPGTQNLHIETGSGETAGFLENARIVTEMIAAENDDIGHYVARQ